MYRAAVAIAVGTTLAVVPMLSSMQKVERQRAARAEHSGSHEKAGH